MDWICAGRVSPSFPLSFPRIDDALVLTYLSWNITPGKRAPLSEY